MEQKALYDWVLPALPEDLAFYDTDGKCFFGSTAHERAAMLRSGRISERLFVMENPGVEFAWFPGDR